MYELHVVQPPGIGMWFKSTLALMICFLLGGCKQKAESGRFAVLQGETDGHPFFAMIDTSFRNEKVRAPFPWYLGISTPLTDPTPDGLPDDKQASLLNDWEDSLEKEIATRCNFAYVGRVTSNGTRTLLYYVDKPEGVIEKLNKVRESHASRPFSLEYKRDEHWDKVGKFLNARQ